MSTFTIYTDLSEEQQEQWLQKVLAKANVGDRILYQGPNQMDQTWYILVEIDGKRELHFIDMNIY